MKIKTTYEVITPESAENGDVAECGREDEEGTEYTVAEAIRKLQGCEPSSSSFHPGVWYSQVDGSTDWSTGAERRESYHLDGYTEAQQKRIFEAVSRR